MFKSCQFFRISLPFYLQTILKIQTPKKELFQLFQPMNIFNLIGEMFVLSESNINDSTSYQVNLIFLRQHLSINLQQKNNKRNVSQNFPTKISNFLQSCLQKVPSSMKNVYLQLYMLFIRLFEVKCIAGMKQNQLKDIKILEKDISNLYRSIKLVLAFQNQYSRIQIKDYVELAIKFLLRNRIPEKFKETLFSLNTLCQLPDTTMQLIEKSIKLFQNKPKTQPELQKTTAKLIQKKSFSEKEIFRNKTKKKILNSMLISKINAQKKIMETPQKQNKNNPNCIDLSDIVERTPELKCRYDIRNPQTSKSPLKNSNKNTKTQYLVSPCSSKKTHLIKKVQDKKKKKNRTLYATRKGMFNNFRRKEDHLQTDICKTVTQTSIHFDSGKKSYIPTILENNSQDFDILAHETPKQQLKKTRTTTKFGYFDRSGKFQVK